MKIRISDSETVKASIVAMARRLDFDAVGFAPATLPGGVRAGLEGFLAAGHHGDMDWLEDRRELRGAPNALWPQAKSVVVVAMNYGPDRDPLDALQAKEQGVISVYARNRDYHDVLKGRLKQLAGQLVAKHGGEVKVFVDTAPVMEKPLAQAAGIGWQGKHTCVVSREYGAWLFLGALFTTLELPPDQSERFHCGSCRACIEVCPTQAIVAEGQLDARRCISYLTIEHKGPIPREFRAAIGNRVYGCDDCLAVCPWNKFAHAAREAGFVAREELNAPQLADLARLDDAAFRTLFRGSPVKRTGRDRFVRNVLIAIGNSGQPDLAGVAAERLADVSPLVRGAAVWALSRLLTYDHWAMMREQYQPLEPDADVRNEWETLDGRHYDLHHPKLSLLFACQEPAEAEGR